MTECPYCGRKLLEDERYCYFCDQDVSKVVDRINEPAKKPEKTKPISAYCVKCNKKVDIKDNKIPLINIFFLIPTPSFLG